MKGLVHKFAKVTGELILVGTLTLITSCTTQPEPIAQLTPVPSGVEVINITEEETVASEIIQQKTFNQCDSASPLRAQIKFSQSDNRESQRELVLGGKVSGEVGVSPVAKVTLEGAVEQHFASGISRSQGHEESVAIEVPSHTQQEYTIIWREIRREGTIEYIENGQTKTTEYSYRIGLELVEAVGRDLPCQEEGVAGEETSVSTPYPTYTPLPTYTPYPTPAHPTPNINITTPTPFPTQAESVNTPGGSTLAVGQWWKSEGVWIRVSDVEFMEIGYIKINLELWNKTGNTIIFDWVPRGNFALADNTNHTYSLHPTYSRSGSDREVIEADELKPIKYQIYSQTVQYDDSNFFNSSVTDLYFSVVDFSRVPIAQWRITVPK